VGVSEAPLADPRAAPYRTAVPAEVAP